MSVKRQCLLTDDGQACAFQANEKTKKNKQTNKQKENVPVVTHAFSRPIYPMSL